MDKNRRIKMNISKIFAIFAILGVRDMSVWALGRRGGYWWVLVYWQFIDFFRLCRLNQGGLSLSQVAKLRWKNFPKPRKIYHTLNFCQLHPFVSTLYFTSIEEKRVTMINSPLFPFSMDLVAVSLVGKERFSPMKHFSLPLSSRSPKPKSRFRYQIASEGGKCALENGISTMAEK